MNIKVWGFLNRGRKLVIQYEVVCLAMKNLIAEWGSTLYVGMQHAVPPTNTKFKPLLLPTQVGMPYTDPYKYIASYFKSTLMFLGPAKRWKSISAARQKREIAIIPSSISESAVALCWVATYCYID